MKYTVCPKCNKSISNNNIKKHVPACTTPEVNCRHCGKECSTPSGRGVHEVQCTLNPDRRSPQLGRKAWNKGLTKHDSNSIKTQGDKLSNTMKRKFDEGYRTASQTDEYWTAERRKQRSEWRKDLHKKDPSSHPNRKLANNRKKMSYPERVAFDFLTREEIEFEYQKQIGNFYPDFVMGNVIVEIDGERWHDNEKDQVRDEWLRGQGYEVYRIKARSRIEDSLKNILSMV